MENTCNETANVQKVFYLKIYHRHHQHEESEVYELEEGEWIPQDGFDPSDSVEGVTFPPSGSFHS
ncbi:hypothetical protein SAY86_005130 [Trapa natans]|uniref:Uncharacterized protein n=1 Tax=Trapa natans TaxID=22666 RepID=A0AAN7KZG6_TRANT|nr:hypothetical protein SAY86_005130 [Trapa natans]